MLHGATVLLLLLLLPLIIIITTTITMYISSVMFRDRVGRWHWLLCMQSRTLSELLLGMPRYMYRHVRKATSDSRIPVPPLSRRRRLSTGVTCDSADNSYCQIETCIIFRLVQKAYYFIVRNFYTGCGTLSTISSELIQFIVYSFKI